MGDGVKSLIEINVEAVATAAEVGAKNSEAAGESKIWSRRLLLALYGVGYREKDRSVG